MTQTPTEAPTALSQAPPVPGAVPVAAAPQAPVEEHMTVQREQFAPWGYDYKACLADANAYAGVKEYGDVMSMAKQYNVDPQTMQLMLGEWARQSQGPGQPFQPAPAQLGPPGLTMEDLQTTLGKFKDDLLPAVQQQQTAALQLDRQQSEYARQRQDAVNLGSQATTKSIEGLLEGLGVKLVNEDETPNVIAEMFRNHYLDSLYAAQTEQLPPELQALHKQAQADPTQFGQQWQDAQDHYFATPTTEHFEEAAKRSEVLRQIKYEMVAEVAAEQEQVPSASLGGGTPSKTQPPDFDKMTTEQKIDLVVPASESDQL
ncbi:hypothetical protein LCGC14_1895040 [marine sediment metagenome]|uniref:Uncharacterized protein n=1 Tax=marine sediment metagenome TaxID=412755 RepID=A0A0F9FYL4_9ZZZZ